MFLCPAEHFTFLRYKVLSSQQRYETLKFLSKSFGTSYSELIVMCICTEANEPSTDWLISATTDYNFPLVLLMLFISSYTFIFFKPKGMCEILRLHPIYAVNKVNSVLNSTCWGLWNFERDFKLERFSAFAVSGFAVCETGCHLE